MIPKHLKFITVILFPISVAGQNLVIANSRQNILYTGVENPIDFALKSFISKDINIIVNRGIVKSVNNSLVFQDCSGQSGVITFYAKNKKNNKVIDSAEFRLKRLPDPRIYIQASNTNEGVYFGKDILTDSHSLGGSIPDFDYNAAIVIQEFKITITTVSQPSKIILNSGSKYSDEVVDAFRKLQENDIVTVSDITIRLGCENLIRTLRQKLVYQKQKTRTISLD